MIAMAPWNVVQDVCGVEDVARALTKVPVSPVRLCTSHCLPHTLFRPSTFYCMTRCSPIMSKFIHTLVHLEYTGCGCTDIVTYGPGRNRVPWLVVAPLHGHGSPHTVVSVCLAGTWDGG